MVVELPLVFALSVHLGHLPQTRKHGLDDSIICGVDDLSDLKRVSPNELVLDPTNVSREGLDERRDTIALLTGQLGLFDAFNALALRFNE